jgi:hypothetical protein
MSNVLSEEQRQQVIALGRLGRLGSPLRRIQQAAGARTCSLHYDRWEFIGCACSEMQAGRTSAVGERGENSPSCLDTFTKANEQR